MPALPRRRTVSALLVAGALVVSAGVGGATAGALITGRDIKDRSITAADIATRTLGTQQLSTEAVASLKTRWNSGAGAPTGEGSVRGDWYLDTATGDAYKNTPSGWELRVNIMGATGAPGAVGPQGATGATGGTGATGETGETGETGAAGEKGETGAAGDAGADGSRWLRGVSAPVAGIGVEGDWYLDTTTYDAYEKGADGWVVVVNLRGPVGPKGDTGATGAQGVAGPQGATGAAGAQGERGATGANGPSGATGPAGPQGPVGPPGAVGPAGPKGDTGAQGPAGPAGGGVTLRDGNGIALGTVVSMDARGVTFVTSTGYLLSTAWDGSTGAAQIYYTQACGNVAGGDAYLNDGGVGDQPMLGRTAVFSGSLDSWAVPSTVVSGYSTSVSFTSASIDNPECGPSAGDRSGWRLRTVTTAELGLPASGPAVNQFALPLAAAY